VMRSILGLSYIKSLRRNVTGSLNPIRRFTPFKPSLAATYCKRRTRMADDEKNQLKVTCCDEQHHCRINSPSLSDLFYLFWLTVMLLFFLYISYLLFCLLLAV